MKKKSIIQSIVDDVSLLNGMFISHLWFANDQDVL